MSFFDFDMNKMRSFMDKATAVVMQYGEMEAKVRAVTNNDPWGSSATDMMDLARHTYNYQDFVEIMGTISKRLNEPVGSSWRQTYKALQLLEFLILNGSEQVIDDAKRRIYDVKGCQNYTYADEKKKDQGVNIRHRATKIVELLADDNLIREERKKAKENKSKYTGVSSADMRFGSNSNSGGHSSSGGHGNSTGFGSDSVRRSSGGGGYSDSAYNSSSNHNEYGLIESKNEALPKVEKIIIEPPKSAPTQPVQNLLDFDAETDEFSGFTSVPAPGSTTLGSTSAGFASFTPGVVPTAQFANFQAFQQPTSQQLPVFANFPPLQQPVATANLNSAPVATSPTSASLPSPSSGFAHFSSIQPAAGFANFGATLPPISASSKSNDDFGDFVDFTAAATASSADPAVDPISKLVSIDAFSLTNSNLKKDPGPSLNSLRL